MVGKGRVAKGVGVGGAGGGGNGAGSEVDWIGFSAGLFAIA